MPQPEPTHDAAVTDSRATGAAGAPRTRRWFGTASLLALLLLGGLIGLSWYLVQGSTTTPAAGGRGPGRGAAATTVGTALAELAEVPITVEALGTVTPTATVTVRPQVSGVLQKVLFKEGQIVKAGQLLAVIDPR